VRGCWWRRGWLGWTSGPHVVVGGASSWRHSVLGIISLQRPRLPEALQPVGGDSGLLEGVLGGAALAAFAWFEGGDQLGEPRRPAGVGQVLGQAAAQGLGVFLLRRALPDGVGADLSRQAAHLLLLGQHRPVLREQAIRRRPPEALEQPERQGGAHGRL